MKKTLMYFVICVIACLFPPLAILLLWLMDG